MFQYVAEEIPSGYLNDGLDAFLGLAESYLKEHRIRYDGELETLGTPRRLVLVGRGLSSSQEDMVQDITGPPKKVAFDASISLKAPISQSFFPRNSSYE